MPSKRTARSFSKHSDSTRWAEGARAPLVRRAVLDSVAARSGPLLPPETGCCTPPENGCCVPIPLTLLPVEWVSFCPVRTLANSRIPLDFLPCPRALYGGVNGGASSDASEARRESGRVPTPRARGQGDC